jgi:predicted Fe-S protein YdhL (DUF1289 family)
LGSKQNGQSERRKTMKPSSIAPGSLDAQLLGTQLYKIIYATSASARGEESSRAMLGKPRLGITGAALAGRIQANTFLVAKVIVQAVEENWPAGRVVDAIIAATHDGFPEEVRAWRTHETFKRSMTGQRYGVTPGKIRAWVKRFKKTLARTLDREDSVFRAAWAEWQWDKEGHPLADGCGRTAKAISAWVLVRHGEQLPIHQNKETYNNAMADGFRKFVAYYRLCVVRRTKRRGPKQSERRPPAGGMPRSLGITVRARLKAVG